jgi:hypothetical protein
MARAGTYAERRQKRTDVVELVAAGASVTDAASRLGIRVDLRAVTELRLDRLATTYSALMDSDDERTRLAGANGLLAVERDRVRLLGTWQKPPREDD